MKLTVLNVAFPMAPAGPDAVGGAEQVLSHLDAGLALAGHQSIVVAAEGSSTKGILIATPRWKGPFDESVRSKAAQAHRKAIAQALARYRVDLIHLHGIDFLDYLPAAGTPVLVTLHLPLQWYPPQIFRTQRPLTVFNCVSASQRRDCPEPARFLPDIENGVPDDLFKSNHAKRKFVLCLGRICPEKGFHLALEAAKLAGSALVLAGEVFPYDAHQKYFREEICPRIDSQRRYIGPIGGRRKRRLLSAARCLLVPSLAPETSSLVAMEALASGTPVVAFPSGALPEIVEHRRTGFLVSSVQEMALAIGNASSIASPVCRQSAKNRFSLPRMVGRYLSLYEELARCGRNGGMEHDDFNGTAKQSRQPALG